MCTTGLKKTELVVDNSYEILELDELYWFVFHKPRTDTRENVYLMTMVSREPRQRIQEMVDAAPSAKRYCTDGYLGYVDIVYAGRHVRNTRDKSDTFTVEGVNADLRRYIPILARRSRCFARTLETLRAVLEVFVDAYNRFGAAKFKYRQTGKPGEIPFGLVDFL